VTATKRAQGIYKGKTFEGFNVRSAGFTFSDAPSE